MNAAQPPSGQPTKWSFLRQSWKLVVAVPTVLTALAGIVTNWHTIESALFPTKAPAEAQIVAEVESDITRPEYVRDLQSRAAPTAAVLGGPSRRPGFTDSYAVHLGPAGARTIAAAFVAVSSGSEPSSNAQLTGNSTEEKAKAEGEKLAQEAKSAEESTTQEKTRAEAEQKTAETRVLAEQKKAQEEKQKAQEDQQRAEETQKQGSAQAKVEQEKARQEAKKADEAVQAKKREVQVKKREAVRPPTQRRIERGAPPSRVEAVLQEAGVPERCRPTCALKPIVEQALKHTSGDASAAARQVRPVVKRNSGAAVKFEVTLKGLEHKVVRLSYALVQDSGPPPPLEYQGQVPMMTFVPKSESELEVGICWVALPSSSRRFHLALTVVDSEKPVRFQKTSSFY
jgi:hypothetical protein